MTKSSESVLFLLLYSYLEFCHCWLFYSPASETQTIQDCIHLKTTNSLFYPNYCDKLLDLKKISLPELSDENSNDTTIATDLDEIIEDQSHVGWGWSVWSDWIPKACPDICGRSCKKRIRVCHGPFQEACADGKSDEFSKCDALNMTKPLKPLGDDFGETDDEGQAIEEDYYEEENQNQNEDGEKDNNEDYDDGENMMKDRSIKARKVLKKRKVN